MKNEPFPFGLWRLIATVFLAGGLLAGALRAQATAANDRLHPSSDITGDYRIAPRDMVQFQIFEEPDLQTLQRVSSSGEIGVPMLGTVRIGGMTLRQAERLIATAYVDQGFFVKPQV